MYSSRVFHSSVDTLPARYRLCFCDRPSRGLCHPAFNDLFPLAWAISPFLGLAGAFKVKKRGKPGGVLFLTAGIVPRLGSLLSSGLAGFGAVIFIFWTPLLILAGVLAISNWPGPYVDKVALVDNGDESGITR
jgi:hypothetical protein